MNRIQKGKDGENLAVQFLLSKEFSILERNFRNSSGEVDIIALKDQTIYFIEVKNWKTNEPLPLEVFTQRKINKMKNLAEYYFCFKNQKESDYYVSFGLIFIRKDTIEFFFDLF